MSMDNGVLYPMDPPPGVVRDPSQVGEASVLTVISIIFFSLATVTIGVRGYARQYIIGKLSLDDYVMLASYAFNVVLVGSTLNLLNYGMGKDLWNVPMKPDLYPNFNMYNLIAAIFFCGATGLAKSSILLFYLRIFPMRSARIAVWAAFGFTMGFSIAGVLVNIFSCNPVNASWNLEAAATAKCINRPVFYFWQAGLSIASDILTVIVPLPWLKSLKLPRKQKIGVGVLLMLGASVCIISGVRLQSLNVLLNDANLTRNTVLALMWCILELNLSIIAGCIPSVKPFVQKLFPRLLSSTRNASTGDAIYLQSGRSRNHTGLNDSAARAKSNYRGVVSTSGPGVSTSGTGSEEFIIAKGNSHDNNEPGTIVKTVQYGYAVEDSSQQHRRDMA